MLKKIIRTQSMKYQEHSLSIVLKLLSGIYCKREIILFKNIHFCLFRELISTQAAMEGMQTFRIFIV